MVYYFFILNLCRHGAVACVLPHLSCGCLRIYATVYKKQGRHLGTHTTTFATRLAMAIAADGRSQGEIADAAVVPPDQLSRWKKGHATPDLESVRKLAP